MENLEAGLINGESLVQYSSVHKEIQLHLQRRLKLSCMSTLSSLKNFIDVTCVQHDGKYLVHCTPLVNFGAIEDIHSDFFFTICFYFFFNYFFLHENQTSIENTNERKSIEE